MDLFTDITPYHWIALGLILLTAEVLGTAGFLLGAAVAALGMGAVLWIVPDMSIGLQLIIYAIGALVASLLYFQIFRDAQSEPSRPLLNKRAARLIGHQFKLDQDIELGGGRVQIGDTMWQVQCEGSIPQGTLVEVVGTHRMQLLIEAR